MPSSLQVLSERAGATNTANEDLVTGNLALDEATRPMLGFFGAAGAGRIRLRFETDRPPLPRDAFFLASFCCNLSDKS